MIIKCTLINLFILTLTFQDSIFMKRIGERVKRRRELLNLQLNDLVGKVGISSSVLSRIEKAKAFSSIITLKSIADNLVCLQTKVK